MNTPTPTHTPTYPHKQTHTCTPTHPHALLTHRKQAAEAAKEGSKLDPTTAAVAKSQDLDAPRQGTSSGGLGGSGGGVGKERKEEGRVQV